MQYEDSQHMIQNILEEVNQLQGERLNTFGENSKTPSLSTAVHDNRYLSSQPYPLPPHPHIKDYQSSHLSQRQSRDIQERSNIDQVLESDRKSQYSSHSKLNTVDEQARKQRQYKQIIRGLEYRLEQKNENQEYRTEETRQLMEENTRLSGENVRLKKQVLSHQYQVRMIETEMNALKQEDNSNRMKEQIKIREEYHRKELREREEEREVQVDRVVRLFQSYIQDLEGYYKGIIEDNHIVVSNNVEETLYSLKRTFNRNKNREIDRIGMEYITTEVYEPAKVRTKSRPEHTFPKGEDNSNQVIQKVKEQLIFLNRLKEKQIDEIRNARDKLSYLDTETEYQKVYLGLIVDFESIRYNRGQRLSLEEHAEMIDLKSEIKILKEELVAARRVGDGDSYLKESKLQKELDILKEYIKQQNESKMKFFSDLQKTKTSNQQIYSENTRLKSEIESLRSTSDTLYKNSKNSRDYQVLEQQYNSLREQIKHKTTKVIEQQKEIRALSQTNNIESLREYQSRLKIKELDELKLFSEIESLQEEINELKTGKVELLDVIRRIGANIETEQELKTLLTNIERENIHLKSEIAMLRESMTQENIAKATNEACRMITDRYQREIHALKSMIDRGSQEYLTLQKINGQLIQDLRQLNQQAKVKGVAVEHLWEVKNAEYQNILGQIKRLQSL